MRPSAHSLSKSKNRPQRWKQDVPALEEYNIIEEWQRHYHKLTDERVGRWRQISQCTEPAETSFDKREGLLVLDGIGRRWELYFFVEEETFNYTTMFDRLCVHPMVSNVEYLPDKTEGQWKMGKDGHWIFLTTTACHPGISASARITISP